MHAILPPVVSTTGFFILGSLEGSVQLKQLQQQIEILENPKTDLFVDTYQAYLKLGVAYYPSVK